MKKTKNNKLEAIVVPSGGSVSEDIERAKKAISYNEFNLPYVISGLGPDTNEAMETNNSKLDYHKELHNYLLNQTSQYIGVDINSVNSIENIKNIFPDGTSGKFAIVSYPLHLKRFQIIFDYLKSNQEISQDIELELISTKQSLKQFLYGSLALLKTKKELVNDWGNTFPYNIVKNVLK